MEHKCQEVKFDSPSILHFEDVRVPSTRTGLIEHQAVAKTLIEGTQPLCRSFCDSARTVACSSPPSKIFHLNMQVEKKVACLADKKHSSATCMVGLTSGRAPLLTPVISILKEEFGES